MLTRDAAWAEPWIKRLIEGCHPKQRDAVLDPHYQITVMAPRGGTKTSTALARLFITMGRKKRADCRFIATTKDHAADIIWAKMKRVAERIGIEARFTETGKLCTFPKNGSELKLIGADDAREVDKLRGIALDAVVIDEAASHPAKLLGKLIDEGFGPRLGERDGWCMMIGTPGHILQGIFYDATRPGGPFHRPFAERELAQWAGWEGWSSHHWTLEYAAQHVAAAKKLWAAALRKKREKGWSDHHPIWLREYMAIWAADDTENIFRYRPHLDDGAPWNQWDPPRVGPHRVAQWPEERDDWMWALAYDKGFADNFAVNALGFSPTDPHKRILHLFCVEKPGVYAKVLAELLLGDALDHKKPGGLFGQLGWPVGIVGDTDESFLAEMRNVYGVPGVAAKRNREAKFGAIELVNGDLVDGRIKILKGSKLEQQVMQLQWVVNEFGDLKENKSQENHSTDCLVYGRKLIAHLFESGQVSEETEKKRRHPKKDEDFDAAPLADWSDLLTSGNYGDDEW